GFHLAPAPEAVVEKTVQAFKDINPDYVIPEHCTGLNTIMAVHRAMPGKLVMPSTGTRVILGALGRGAGEAIANQPPAKGVLSPVVTPFKPDLAPDAERFVRQCRWLLSQNVGLAVFGTNSEANSLSIDEKIELLDRLVGSGLDPARMMPGTGHCALPDSVRLTAHAVKLGAGGVLMLPPFYYKGGGGEGLF